MHACLLTLHKALLMCINQIQLHTYVGTYVSTYIDTIRSLDFK